MAGKKTLVFKYLGKLVKLGETFINGPMHIRHL